jgi:RNA polymerase sigma factor (sigma-70 family)
MNDKSEKTRESRGIKYRENDGTGIEMSQEELAALVLEYRRANAERRRDIAETILKSKEGLLAYLVKKHFGTYMRKHRDDVMQEARIGLLDCLDKYDPDRTKFSTWLTFHVKHRVYDYLMAHHSTTRYMQGQLAAYDKALGNLTMTGISHPTIEEVAAEMKVGVEAVRSIMETRKRLNMISIDNDEILTGEEGDPSRHSPEIITLADEKVRAITGAMEKLTPTQRRVIGFWFGSYDKSAAAYAGGAENALADIRKTTGLLETEAGKLAKADGGTEEHKDANEALRDATDLAARRVAEAEKIVRAACGTDDARDAERLCDKADELAKQAASELADVRVRVYRALWAEGKGETREEDGSPIDPREFEDRAARELAARKRKKARLAAASDEPTLGYASKRLGMKPDDIRRARVRACGIMRRNEELARLFRDGYGSEIEAASVDIELTFGPGNKSVRLNMEVFDDPEIVVDAP